MPNPLCIWEERFGGTWFCASNVPAATAATLVVTQDNDRPIERNVLELYLPPATPCLHCYDLFVTHVIGRRCDRTIVKSHIEDFRAVVTFSNIMRKLLFLLPA